MQTTLDNPGDIPLNETLKHAEYSCLGGTFDSMHLGHKVFLSVGSLASKKLLVGVTSQFMLTKKSYSYIIESLPKRKWNVAKFLHVFDKYLEPELYTLEDGLGPYTRGSF